MGHLPKFFQWMIMSIGFPAVCLYHTIMWNPFLNISTHDASIIEEVGNQLLSPLHYLCVGKEAIESNDPDLPYRLIQKYDYRDHFVVNTTGAVISLPFSLPIGSFVKGISYLFEGTRERHRKVVQSLQSTKIDSDKEYYQKIGLDFRNLEGAIWLKSQNFTRQEGAEEHLQEAKIALGKISKILRTHNIPHWVDLGTCLGTYRYGGVIPWDYDIDMGILSKDFDNALQALRKLDPKKYQVQDWSSRYRKAPLLKVYLRKTKQLIDIFNYAIDEEKKEIQMIVANEDSRFLSDKWQEHERAYTKSISFDDIFPLKLAEFDGIEVPVPNHTKRYLQSKYGENIEPARIYDKKTRKYEKDLSHPYWQRANVY
ncbi:MAG: LicD family protein [Simkaniaceae bacterium]